MSVKSTVALVNAGIIDGTGRQPIMNGVLVISGKRIVDVGTEGSVSIPEDARIVDLKGMYILPGLIDAHLHLLGMRTGDLVKEPLTTPYEVFVARVINDLKELVNAGFTTVGDAGSLIAINLKQAVDEGSIVSPRIIASGYVLSQTFGHGDIHYLPIDYVDARTSRKTYPLGSLICDGVDECRKAARYALRAGADFIKVMATGGVLSQRDRPEYVQFTLDELKAIVEEAEHAGRFVHAHAEGSKGIVNAVKSGIKIIAHANLIDDEGIQIIKENNGIIIPTFSVVENILEYGEEVGIPKWGLEKCRELHEVHVENMRKTYRAGVKIATGTDFIGGYKAFKHGDNALEIFLLVKRIGMSPMEAIVSATRNASEAIGLEKYIGTLEPGKLADLIVVNSNPLNNIEVLMDKSRIIAVIKEGVNLKGSLIS
ncbi:MAG: amidohydrolase family protein [Candidatus Methanomethylicia archaeon]